MTVSIGVSGVELLDSTRMDGAASSELFVFYCGGVLPAAPGEAERRTAYKSCEHSLFYLSVRL